MNRLSKLLVALSFSLFAIMVAATDLGQVDSQLKKADELRSANHAEFVVILDSLEPHFDQFSIDQKYYFLYLKGYSSAFDGDMQKAINLYRHVHQNSQNIELNYRASVSLVNLHALTKDWLAGFEYLDVISRNYEKVTNTDIRHQGLVSASVFYNELEQYEMTLSLISRLFSEQVEGRNLCMALSLKLKADLSTENYTTLEKDLFKAIESCLDVNEVMVVNVLRTYLADFYQLNNEWQEIIDLFENNYAEIQRTGYQLLKSEVDSLLAHAYFKQNKITEAEKYAKKVLDINHEIEYSKVVNAAYKTLAQVAKQNGNHELALDMQDKYIQSSEQLFEQSKARQIAVESAKHRAKEKDNQIELLNKQNTILRLENKFSEETAFYNRWIIALLVLSTTILILWITYVKRSQKKLKFLAEYDSLTEISNRAYFYQSAEAVLNYYSKTDRTASLVLFDLDYFKKINDKFGHPVGDKVLKAAAKACKACVRKVDVFGRVGGEEFAILLPGCEQEQALNIANECRKKISEIDIQTLGIDSPVTASFGIADSGMSGYLLKDLVAHADEAMYIAKHRGRDQVVCHTP